MAPPPKKNNSTEGPILANFKIPPPRVTPQINNRGGGKGKKLPPLFFQTWGKANSSAFRRRRRSVRKPIVIRILTFLGPKKIWVWADIDPGSKSGASCPSSFEHPKARSAHSLPAQPWPVVWKRKEEEEASLLLGWCWFGLGRWHLSRTHKHNKKGILSLSCGVSFGIELWLMMHPFFGKSFPPWYTNFLTKDCPLMHPFWLYIRKEKEKFHTWCTPFDCTLARKADPKWPPPQQQQDRRTTLSMPWAVGYRRS